MELLTKFDQPETLSTTEKFLYTVSGLELFFFWLFLFILFCF